MRWRILVSLLSLAIICLESAMPSGVRNSATRLCTLCIGKRTTSSLVVNCPTLILSAAGGA